MLIEEDGFVCFGGPLQSLFIGLHHQDLRDHPSAGLLSSGGGDFLPALQLLADALLIRPGDAPGGREGHDLCRPQLRSLLDHVLQLVCLGKGHIHAGPDLCLRGAGAALSQGQSQALRVCHSTQALLPRSVTEQDLLPRFQPENLSVLGVFAGEGMGRTGKLPRSDKKTNHIINLICFSFSIA